MDLSNVLDWLSLRGQLCALRFTTFKFAPKLLSTPHWTRLSNFTLHWASSPVELSLILVS